MSLGTALAGTVLFIGLAASFQTQLANQPGVNTALQAQTGIAVENGVGVVPISAVETAAHTAGLSAADTQPVVTAYSDAKLQSLREALAIIAIVGILGLMLTTKLPSQPPGTGDEARAGPTSA